MVSLDLTPTKEDPVPTVVSRTTQVVSTEVELDPAEMITECVHALVNHPDGEGVELTDRHGDICEVIVAAILDAYDDEDPHVRADLLETLRMEIGNALRLERDTVAEFKAIEREAADRDH